MTLANELRSASMSYCVFSSLGQSLNNEYEIYQRRIVSEQLDLVGVGLHGNDETVRNLTQKFSVLS
jgi:Protein of unknown function (DUF2000)